MSGGHWGYMEQDLEDRARSAAEVWRLLAALEHELDWGQSADTCLACAEIRTGKALSAFFDTHCTNATTAIALARDREQHQCSRCQARRKTTA